MPTTPSNPLTLSHEIDTLLEQYLTLLNTYTQLRAELSAAQSSLQQNLSRANFTADRGVRYGSDCYDSRMRASRIVTISPSNPNDLTISEAIEQREDENLEGDKHKDEGEVPKDGKGDAQKKDPIRMFGILTPQALKLAQKDAIRMVEGIVPRLVRVEREMGEVEIEVRRRRKWLGKVVGDVAHGRQEVVKVGV